ncbi:MAG: leucyl aminopeptidase family protein [Pseudomonadota bacterium]
MVFDFAQPSADAVALRLTDKASLAAIVDGLSAPHSAWLDYQGFGAELGKTCILPSEAGAPDLVLVGVGTPEDRARRRFAIGAAIAALPAGTYQITSNLPEGIAADEIALGYLLACYRFDRYRSAPPAKAHLIAPDGIDADRLKTLAEAEALTRDLINTPAEDMGPPQLEEAARALAERFDAAIEITQGEALLEGNFPLIHTVGRAAERAPRLIDLRWGVNGPKVTLVGKGVCFDTGGLNLKPGASMSLMKKDMGGAANVLGLAQMVMAQSLPVQLRVLIPAVENAVSGNAFRPGDIFRARNEMSVEINNTDAEGRLVLADALAYAAEDAPDLLISIATLTGAARVALGPDIAPFFTDDPGFAESLTRASDAVADPVWRMPFYPPYEAMIEPGIADLDNAPKGGFAGAITAALFLRRFTDNHPRYAHFDIYGWQPNQAPGRPKGGALQGARAIFEALPEVLSLD